MLGFLLLLSSVVSFGGAREDETRLRLYQHLTTLSVTTALYTLPTTILRITLPALLATLPTTRPSHLTTILRILHTTLLALLATLLTTPLAIMAKRIWVVYTNSQPLSRDTSSQHRRIVLYDGQLSRHGFEKEGRKLWAERARQWRKKHFKLGQKIKTLQKRESTSARLDELAEIGIKAPKCLCGGCDIGIDCLGYPCWPSCRHYDLKSW